MRLVPQFTRIKFASLLLATCLVGSIVPPVIAQEFRVQAPTIPESVPQPEPTPPDNPPNSDAPAETPAPSAESSNPTEPVAPESAPDEPMGDEPTTDEPAVDEPGEQPATDEPDAEPNAEEPASTNANSLINQCRLTNRTISVFTKPSVADGSEIVATLSPATAVLLASEGYSGWIKISEPARGFVIARHLTLCPDEPETPPEAPQPTPAPPTSNNDFPFPQDPTLLNITAGACRRAIVDLAIRPEARSDARPFIGSVKEGETMILTGESVLGAEYRQWLQISQPYPGWISGGVEGGTNLAFCS